MRTFGASLLGLTLLAAAVDRRVDQKRVHGVLNAWDDVQQAFDGWSEKLRARLAQVCAG